MPARACPPVPRLLFEDWTREDFRRVWDSEDEIEELSKAVVQVAKVRLGAPRGQHRLPPDHGSPGLGAFPWVMSSCAWPGCRGGGSEGHRSGQHTRGALASLLLASAGIPAPPLREGLACLWPPPHLAGPPRTSTSTASWWRSGASC